MTDIRSRANDGKRELTETDGAFHRVREAMTAQLFATPIQAGLEREKLYLGVQALDAVKAALMSVIDSGRIEEADAAIKAHFASKDITREPFSRAA